MENMNENYEIVEINEAEVNEEPTYEETSGYEMGNGTAAILGGLVTLAGIAAVKGAKKLWKKHKAKKEQKKFEKEKAEIVDVEEVKDSEPDVNLEDEE